MSLLNNKKLALVAFGYLSYLSSLGQITNFDSGFKKGFKDGYCYEKGLNICIAPINPYPPLPRIGENHTSYQDGYQRGFQTGLDLIRLENIQNNSRTRTVKPYEGSRYIPSDYVAPYDLNLLKDVLVKKQAIFDSRVNWIQHRIFALEDLAYCTLAVYSPTEYNEFSAAMQDLVKNQMNGKPIDFTDNNIFTEITSKFKLLEKYIYLNFIESTTELSSITIPNVIPQNASFTIKPGEGIVIVDNGVTKNGLQNLGAKACRLESGKIKIFTVMKDKSGRKYFLPHELVTNPILNDTHFIFAK